MVCHYSNNYCLARTTRLRNEFVLPVDAIEGLKNALIDCSRLPKQLQYEADQVNDFVYLIYFLFFLVVCQKVVYQHSIRV